MNSNTAVAPVRGISRQVADSIAKTLGTMTKQFRERIFDETVRHVGSSGQFRVCRIASKNLGVSEQLVEAVLITTCLEQRSRLAALETGIYGALEMSAEAGREVWAEIRAVHIQARSI